MLVGLAVALAAVALLATDAAAAQVTSELFSVTCPTATACYAVGYSSTTTGVHALVERLVGNTWTGTTVKIPSSGTSPLLSAASCAAARYCFAVGSVAMRSTGFARTLIARFNGTTWAANYGPGPTNVAYSGLSDVACASPTNCLSTGGALSGPFALQWNGSLWKTTPKPVPSAHGEDLGLNAIACPAAKSCFAVGDIVNQTSGDSVATAIEHWNGATWKLTRRIRRVSPT